VGRWTINHVVEWFDEVTLDQFQYKWKDKVMEVLQRQQINGPVLECLTYQVT
jgi:hypothetical protein